ncbi:MAG: BamA/OMP85 family outer membrane protein [bacterium]
MSIIFALLFISQSPVVGKVDEVQFQGNRTFHARTLLGVVQVKPGQPTSEPLLDQEARNLEEFYSSHGFLTVKVEKGLGVIKGKRVVTFYINEGPRSKIAAIIIEGNQAFADARLRRLIQFGAGSYLNTILISAGAQALRNLYLNNGYPFVEVQDSFEPRDTAVTVRYHIDEGPLCHIQAIRVRGNRRVATSTILKTGEIKPGERFSRSRLEQARRQLYATKLFSRSLYYVLKSDSAADSVEIRFDVIEQEQQGIGLGVGFETPPNRLLFSFDWEHNNLFNRGQWLIASSSFSPDLKGNYRLNLDLTWRMPYLLWQRIDFQTQPFFYFEKLDSSRHQDYGIQTGMSRDLIPQLRLGVFNRLRLVADTGRGVTNSLALNLIYDSRDNLLDPKAGLYIQPLVELAGGPFLGNNDFLRIRTDCRLYQAIISGFVIAVRFAGGRVLPYGRSDVIPYYEEFSLGGSNNLRGYPERSLGPDTASSGRFGPVVVNGNLELRTPYLWRWVGLVGFFDFGQVAGQQDLRLRGFEAGTGTGIRVRTPVGPLRLDWGKRLKSAPTGDWGRFYIGILHAF